MKTTSTAEELKERLRRRSKHQADPPQDLRSPRKLQFEEIYSFFKDITSGLDHLHAGGYIHRDLKPSNCLLHDIGHGEIRVLVSDFGEVQVANTARSSTGATGTISYCAPETLRRDASTGMFGNFTAKSDVFSLGMILYFLCFAQLPYHNADSLNEENDDVNELRAEITSWVGLEDQREKRPELPDKLYKFLRRLLSLDPSDRPTTDEILHGIKTGSGLEESAPPRARSAGHIFEEIRGNPRVSAVDTSPDGSSVPKKSTTLGRGSAPSKLRISPLRNDAQSSALPPDYLHNESVSPGGSLVLHSRHTSPTAQAAPHELRPPFHDPGPHPFQLAHSPDAARALKAVLLIVKICSVGLLCSPMAARPAASAVLVGGATLDVVLGGGVYVSLLLAALHGGVLGWALQAGVLCVPAARVWEVL
jgi:serine/threonine protein kinase